MELLLRWSLAVVLSCLQAAAQLSLINPPSSTTNGPSLEFFPNTNYIIFWTGYTGVVRVTLDSGTSTDASVYDILGVVSTGTTYNWNTGDLPEGPYIIEIGGDSGGRDVSVQLQLVSPSQSSSGASTKTTQSSSSPSSSASAVSSPSTSSTTSSTPSQANSSTTSSSLVASTSTTSSSPTPSSITSSPTTTLSSSASPTSSFLSTSSASPEPTNSKSSLSTGAKAGIGIGTGIGGILCIAVVGYFFFRQGMRFAHKSATGPATGILEKAELGAEESAFKEAREGEGLNRNRAVELDGLELFRPAELPDHNGG